MKKRKMKKRKEKKKLSTKNSELPFYQRLQQVNLNNLFLCIFWQCHFWIQFLPKLIGFVFMKDMNDELVNKFKRRIFGVKKYRRFNS